MDYVLVDVREPEEYARGHLEGSINLPPSEIMNGAAALKDIPKDANIIVYCITGSRSNVSMRFLSDMGYTNVINGINPAQVQAKYL